MKIGEILTESQNQELEEGPLGTIGRAAAGTLGAIGKGAGMIAGIGRGLKTAYQKGKATSAAHIAGDVPKSQDSEAQAIYDKEYARLTRGLSGAEAKNMGVVMQFVNQMNPEQKTALIKAIQRDITSQKTAPEQPQARVEPTMGANPAANPAAAPAGARTPPAANPAAAPAGFKQGGYGQTTTNAPTGVTPPQPTPGTAKTPTPQGQLPAGGKGTGQNFDPQTGKPISQYGQQKQSQSDLKARLKAGQGLAKTSGGGFQQGKAKGDARLAAAGSTVKMSHVPSGNAISESSFTLYRKK